MTPQKRRPVREARIKRFLGAAPLMLLLATVGVDCVWRTELSAIDRVEYALWVISGNAAIEL